MRLTNFWQVFLPSIAGHVPPSMVQCVAALLDFSYLARRSAHDLESLDAMDEALARFHEHRVVFQEAGIRPNGFSLPRQHALVHYVENIKLFGSPNGLCSSITESAHIRAVKRPWRRSSKYKPLLQILRTNTRLSKLAAARAEYKKRGMLVGDVLHAALRTAGLNTDEGDDEGWEDIQNGEDMMVGNRQVLSVTEIGHRAGKLYWLALYF